MDLDSGVQILSKKLMEYNFICIKHQIHIMSESGHNHYFCVDTFSVNGVVTLYSDPLDRVSC
jgi:hypothetical protein